MIEKALEDMCVEQLRLEAVRLRAEKAHLIGAMQDVWVEWQRALAIVREMREKGVVQ